MKRKQNEKLEQMISQALKPMKGFLEKKIEEKKA